MLRTMIASALIFSAGFASAESYPPSVYGLKPGMTLDEVTAALEEHDHRPKPGVRPFKPGEVRFDIGGDEVIVDEAEMVDYMFYQPFKDGAFDENSGDFVYAYHSASHEVDNGVYSLIIKREFEPGEVSRAQLKDWVKAKVGFAEPSCVTDRKRQYFFSKDGNSVLHPDLCDGFQIPTTPRHASKDGPSALGRDIDIGISFGFGSSKEKPSEIRGIVVVMTDISTFSEIIDAKRRELEETGGDQAVNPLSDM